MKKKLYDFLKKNFTMTMIFIAFVSGIIGWSINWIFPSKAVVAKNAPKKELTCILNYSNHLVKRATSDSRLQILYDGQTAEDPVIYDISIQNSGNQAIDNGDFKQNFVIAFPGCGKILSAQVHESSNTNISDEILSNAKIEGEMLLFTDFFLNPNESFTVTVITDKKADAVKYNARISGVSELIIRNTPKEKQSGFRVGATVVISIVFIAAIIIGIFAIRSQRELSRKFEILETKRET